MELRHLDTMLAIDAEGSFTAAAEALHTVQSNVSEQVRQLEVELGVPLLVRGRRGAQPTEFGLLLLERARRIRQEIEALRLDLAMVQGLEAGHATMGVVGTISRWLVPAVVADLRVRAPGVSLRVNEGASERLAADVAEHVLSQAVITEPVTDPRLVSEHLIEEDLVGLVPTDLEVGTNGKVTLAELAEHPMVLPPVTNPLRGEVDAAARTEGVTLKIPVEIEGVRLIPDLVAAHMGVSVIPEIAVPTDDARVRTVRIEHMPPRRVAIVAARGARLSLADQAVREAVIRHVHARG